MDCIHESFIPTEKIGRYSDLKFSILSTPHFQFMIFDSFIRIILTTENDLSLSYGCGSMAKTVLIAVSNHILSEALADTLSLLEFIVVGTTAKRQKVAPLAQETKPDLLIFDCHMSNDQTGGYSDLQLLKEQLPNMKILALACHETVDETSEKLLRAGIDGFWNKYDNWLGLLKQLNILFP